jgi:hypothetical protein
LTMLLKTSCCWKIADLTSSIMMTILEMPSWAKLGIEGYCNKYLFLFYLLIMIIVIINYLKDFDLINPKKHGVIWI